MLPRRRVRACRTARVAALAESCCCSSKVADTTSSDCQDQPGSALGTVEGKSSCANDQLADVTALKDNSIVVATPTVEELADKVHQLCKSIPTEALSLSSPADRAKPHIWALLRQHERIWQEILQVLLQVAELVHQGPVQPQDVTQLFAKQLKDTAWLWDTHRATWCTLQDSCMCVDDEDLAQMMQGSGYGAPAVHFIRFVDHQGRVLSSSGGDCRTSVSQGQLLALQFSLLGIPTVVQSTDCAVRFMPTECAVGSQFVSNSTLKSAAISWYFQQLQLGPGSVVTAFTDHFAAAISQLSDDLAVVGASQLECQLTLRLRGTVIAVTSWMPKAAVLNGNTLLMAPHTGDAPEYQPDQVFLQAAQELARHTSPLHRVSLQKALLRSLQSLCRVAVNPACAAQQARQDVNSLLMATYAVTKKPTIERCSHDCSTVQWFGAANQPPEYMPIMRRWGAVLERVAANCGDLQKLIKPVYWSDLQGNLHPGSEDMKRYQNPVLDNALGKDLLSKPEYILCLDASQLETLLPVELLAFSKDANSKTGRSGEIAVALVVTLLLSQLGVEVDHLQDVQENGDHWDVEGRSPEGRTLKFEVKSTGRTHLDPESRAFSVSKLEWDEATSVREDYVIVRPFRVPIHTGCRFNRDLEPLLLLFIRNAPKQVAKRAIFRAYDGSASGKGKCKVVV